MDNLRGILGVTGQGIDFEPKALYPETMDLEELQSSFTELEVQVAIHNLAPNKAFGPDGLPLPNEFVKLYWPALKENLMGIINDFYEGRLDLTQSNRANIVLILKKEGPKSVYDFRPILIINLMPKVISKVLSNRVSPLLPKLISINQTAFIKGQFISENFIAIRKLLLL